MMDRHRIAVSVLSVSSPGVQFLSGGPAAKLARAVNEAGAEIAAGHPGRFGLFISLPLPDVGASLDEIDYGFDVLGADGVVLMTNIQGRCLGEPAFSPVFEALDRRGAVVYLHPTSPCGLGLAGMGFACAGHRVPFDNRARGGEPGLFRKAEALPEHPPAALACRRRPADAGLTRRRNVDVAADQAASRRRRG